MLSLEVHVSALPDGGYLISLGPKQSSLLQVERHWQQVLELLTKLQEDFPHISIIQKLPLTDVIDANDLEKILAILIQAIGKEWWSYEPLALFFDEYFHQSLLSKICLRHYQYQEQQLLQKIAIQEGHLNSIDRNAKSMYQVLSEISKDLPYLQNQHPALVIGLQSLQKSVVNLLQFNAISPNSLSSSAAGEIPSSISASGSPNAQGKTAPSQSKERSLSDNQSTLLAPYEPSMNEYHRQPPSPHSLAGNSITSTSEPTIRPVSETSPSQYTLQPTTAGVVVPVPTIPLEPLPDEWNLPFEEVIDDLLIGILPHESQIQYRMSALALLKREIRAVLGVVAYDLGLFAIRCFLTDDPIKITVIVNPTQLAWWHTTLSEKLKGLIENPNELHRLISEPGDLISEELKIIMTHNIRNILCLPNDKTSSYKITCNIDSLESEITANNRNELCLLSFLEEFSNIIGKNQLFKKSLLFIRSWWLYEATNISGYEMKYYLNEYSIAIMVVGIFNQYSNFIHNPMIALLYFLRDYSQFDVYNQAITIQGIVNYENDPSTTATSTSTTSMSNQPKLISPQSHHLINNEILEKYWKMFNLNDPLNIEPPSGVPKPQLDFITRLEMLKISMYRACARFERKGFDIIHPFLITNMISSGTPTPTSAAAAGVVGGGSGGGGGGIPDKVSANKRVSLMQKAFVTGYQTLLEGLKQVKTGQITLNEFMKKSFTSTHMKVKGQWRHDSVNNTVPVPSTSDPSWTIAPSRSLTIENGISKFIQYIHYCNFTADAILSESALITFCIDLLLIRGPLPAGEVGKILSEASSVQNLSHRLREKYGGLKKFLEKFPELFIFSNDHPFNPHILLRQTISNDNLELIDRGIFPLHLLSKTSRPTISYANLPRKPPSKVPENSLPTTTAAYTSMVPPGPGSNSGLSPVSHNHRYGSVPPVPPIRTTAATYDYQGMSSYDRHQSPYASARSMTLSHGSSPYAAGGSGAGYGDQEYRSYGGGGVAAGSGSSYRRSPLESSTYNSYYTIQKPSELSRPPLSVNDYGYDSQVRKYPSPQGSQHSAYDLLSASERNLSTSNQYYSDNKPSFTPSNSSYSASFHSTNTNNNNNLPDNSSASFLPSSSSSYGERSELLSRGGSFTTSRYDSGGSSFGSQQQQQQPPMSRVVGGSTLATNSYGTSNSLGFNSYPEDNKNDLTYSSYFNNNNNNRDSNTNNNNNNNNNNNYSQF